MITQEYLNNTFLNVGGLLYWKVRKSGRSLNCPAGTIQKASKTHYQRIMIEGVRYLAHRLVWCMQTGYYPTESEIIDHYDHNGLNNEFSNLRIGDYRFNAQNRITAFKGTSGYLGVSWYKDQKKWRARITSPIGKRLHLGYFETSESAFEAYKTAKRVLHAGNTL